MNERVALQVGHFPFAEQQHLSLGFIPGVTNAPKSTAAISAPITRQWRRRVNSSTVDFPHLSVTVWISAEAVVGEAPST
ncbi:hypothetical protein ACWEOE_32995 [Amycolatopsis sp. NPDC004368]